MKLARFKEVIAAEVDAFEKYWLRMREKDGPCDWPLNMVEEQWQEQFSEWREYRDELEKDR